MNEEVDSPLPAPEKEDPQIEEEHVPVVEEQVEDIHSPISAQIFEFCDSDIFPQMLQSSEVASSSNCYDDISYRSALSLPLDFDGCDDIDIAAGIASAGTAATATTGAFSSIFDPQDEIDNDISVSIDFSKFDFSLPAIDITSAPAPAVPMMAPPLTAGFGEECMGTMAAYHRMNTADTAATFGSFLPASLSSDGIFRGNSIMLGNVLQSQELDFNGDNSSLYSNDPMHTFFNPGELQQAFGMEGGQQPQQMVSVGGRGGSSSTLTAEINGQDDSGYKVGKLSQEERQEKIHRYLKKRNERNFSKKIKYACRKTLADSRPRVRGRFAKNDELYEMLRPINSQRQEEEDEEEGMRRGEGEDLDLFSHIGGVNSFNCNNYSIKSWI